MNDELLITKLTRAVTTRLVRDHGLSAKYIEIDVMDRIPGFHGVVPRQATEIRKIGESEGKLIQSVVAALVDKLQGVKKTYQLVLPKAKIQSTLYVLEGVAVRGLLDYYPSSDVEAVRFDVLFTT